MKYICFGAQQAAMLVSVHSLDDAFAAAATNVL